MIQDQIKEFINTGFAHGVASPPDPRYVFPIIEGLFHGISAARVPPGIALDIPIPRNRVWLIIIDDRAPGAAGPESFNPETIAWLLTDAFQIAVDCAEPCENLYKYFVELASK